MKVEVLSDAESAARRVGPSVAWDLVETFLAAEYIQAERHLRRLAKVAPLQEQEQVSSTLRGKSTSA